MRQNETREKAALLVAEDKLTDEQIAADVGVNRMTLYRWKEQPTFQKRVQEIVSTYRTALVRKGIAERQARIDALSRNFDLIQEVITERGADPDMQDIPGGKTGIVIRQMKQVGSGRDAQVVEEYAVDVGTLKEMRATMQQAAQELGEWTDKREVSATIDLAEELRALMQTPVRLEVIDGEVIYPQLGADA